MNPADRLVQAAAEGSQDLVLELLAQNDTLTPNSPDQEGRRALHCAISHKHYALVHTLVGCGADVNAHANLDQTQYLQLVQHFQTRGITMKGRSLTALHLAAQHGDIRIASLLLSQGADLNQAGVALRTPLHEAVGQDNFGMVLLLLSCQPDLSRQSIQGFTVLHEACLASSPEIVSSLLEYGADPHAQDRDGATPLHAAALLGRADVVEQLLYSGADPRATSSWGLTPLHAVAVGKATQRFSRAEGAAKGPCLQDHKRTIQILMQHGALATDLDSLDYSPLHMAANVNRQELAEELLKGVLYKNLRRGSHKACEQLLAFLCSFKRLEQQAGLPRELIIMILQSTSHTRQLVIQACIHGVSNNALQTLKKKGHLFMPLKSMVNTLFGLCYKELVALCTIQSGDNQTACDVAAEQGWIELALFLNPGDLETRLPSLIARWLDI